MLDTFMDGAGMALEKGFLMPADEVETRAYRVDGVPCGAQ